MATSPWPNSPAATHLSATELGDIFQDVDGSIHGPVDGFITKYFGKYSSILREHVSRRAREPAPSAQGFLRWFLKSSAETPNGARGVWHVRHDPASQIGNGANEDADHFLTFSTEFESIASNTYEEVQVVGKLCIDDSLDYQQGLLSLSGHARRVFASQPTRLFLHGLYIRQSIVELWVFDRSEMYSCDPFDHRTDLGLFLTIVLSFQNMSNRELGMSDAILNDRSGSYITLHDSPETSLQKLYLEEQTIASSEDLFGEGTTCYRAKPPGANRWDYVVKFKWRLASDRPEDELLKLAKKKNVWGVVSLDYYKLTAPRIYAKASTSGHTEASSRNKIRQGSLKMLSRGKDKDPLALPWASSNIQEKRIEALKIEYSPTPWFPPPGHRSLFQDAGILHQDVSAENIIITDAEGEGDPRGILIDLDVALNLADGTPGQVTGTRPFMSIGILKRRRHRYRHDLESFLYVFLWTIIANRDKNPPRTSKLRQWSRGSWDKSAAQKMIDLDKNNFGSILPEFSPEFHPLKPLCESLREILFPLEDGVIWTGTDSAPEAVNGLYDGMISAFQGAQTLAR